jgi:hypothetical protein
MATRRPDGRGRARADHEQQELQDGGRPSPARVGDSGGPGNVSDHLLSLQRDYGNEAVTTVVQRRGGAASTDAPGHHVKSRAKHEAPQEDFAPTEPNPKFAGMSDAELTGHADDYSKGATKNGLYYAAELLEEYWFRHKDSAGRAIAMNIWRVYKQLPEPKREAFWLGVFQGRIKPGQASSEDLSDKSF